MEVLDESTTSINQDGIVYGGFWPRLGAMLLDGLIMAPVTVAVMYFNTLSWKSVEVLIVLTLLSLIYKPFCEFTYGATLGKMALRLKVVNLQFEKASLEEILLRNIFHIVPPLFSLAFTIGIYNDPEFQDIDGFMAYSAYSQRFLSIQVVSWISSCITIVDLIFLLADNQKRSLHDRIGKTFVVVR